MELLRELLYLSQDNETNKLLEELGNLGKLGLGSMVNAFKQSYTAYNTGLHTSPEGKKFNSYNARVIGKDSEAVDYGSIKSWSNLSKAYDTYHEQGPQAAIFLVDKKPVSLMIANYDDISSINNRVALAWDFTKLSLSDDEMNTLTKGLNDKDSTSGYNRSPDITTKAPGKSERVDTVKDSWDDKTMTKAYSGFTQTVREVKPFVNNLGKTFGSRLELKLILADQTRISKRNSRLSNRPIDPSQIKLFTDDIKVRLAKYKNSKLDSAEDAQEFVNKVFEGGMKKIKFAGRAYTAVPPKKYLGSNQEGGGHKNRRSFYNGTMNDLFTGKAVTIEFEADRNENDYNTLYLTVKLVKGTLTPVSMRYSEKDESYGKSREVKF